MGNCPIVALVLVAGTTLGCGSSEPSTKTPSKEPSSSPSAEPANDWPGLEAQKNKATQAKKAMFAALSGRLTEVMADAGPAAAVAVCAEEAPLLAAGVAEKLGVRIGRTSFRLRNANNQPPEWAVPALVNKPEQDVYIELPGQSLGAILPIRMMKLCERCHGDDDAIDADVRTTIAKYYPDDQATGFHDGDLRGWFWIEVPPQP